MPQSFIQELIDKKSHVTIFLVNGVKLTGTIVRYENFIMPGLILQRERRQQFVLERNMSTIMPDEPHVPYDQPAVG